MMEKTRSIPIPCPTRDQAPCFNPGCSRRVCLQEFDQEESTARSKLEAAEREASQRVKDRQEAAGRVLRELAFEQKKPTPQGQDRQDYMFKILAYTERYGERVQQHVAEIERERAEKRKPSRRRSQSNAIDIDLG